MLTNRSYLQAKNCLLLGAALVLAGCSSWRASRGASAPDLSPAARMQASAYEDFARGREAALSGDLQCAEDYFDRALQTVRPVGSPPPSDPELLAFSFDLYDGILRYEALATPVEEVAASEDHIAPELEKIQVPVVASEEAITEARDAVASDAVGITYDMPIVVNEAVLNIMATFQNDLHDVIARGLARSGRYIPMIHRIFAEEGIPKDLAQVAMIESSFLPHAHSRMTAHGIWQFMPRTGRQYGLTANGIVDERSDPEKATRAAARHLSYLRELFHDWYLALAAYNAGEGKILRAMERAGLNDFWQLAASGLLRPQTQNYVPAVIAATLISKNPVHYGFQIEYERPLEYETVTLTRPVKLRHLADNQEVTVEALQLLNPELRGEVTPRQFEGYELKVPVGSRESVVAAFAAAPTAHPAVFRRHIARRGETLAAIARRFHVSVAALAQANSVGERAKLRRGRVVLIPQPEVVRVASRKARKARVPGATRVASKKLQPPVASYRVRGGDTLYRIAARHGTTVQLLLAANSLSSGAPIHPGDRLKIPGRPR